MATEKQKEILEFGGKKLARNEHHITKRAVSGTLSNHRLWCAIIWLTGFDAYSFGATAGSYSDLKAQLERQKRLETDRLKSRHPLADKNRLIMLHQVINSLTIIFHKQRP